MLIIKKTFRWIIYAILLILILMVIAAAFISFVVFPNINQYKNDISAIITEKISLKTTIGHIETDWDDFSPRILIREIDIYDTDNNSALHLENVKGTFSWLSIPMLHPHLSYISISNPKLAIHRKANGSIYVAGIPLAGEGNPDLANWLLSQTKISVKNAAIIWQDDLRQAPKLALNNVYFKLGNPAWRQLFGQHLFSLSALPSTGTENPIHVDGHFFGRDISKIETWRGEVNLTATDIDLTAWKAWLDYPIDLQSGAGDTRVSFEFSDKKLNKLKADIELRNLAGQFSEKTQPFNAELLSGLVTWEEAKKITTITAQDIRLKSGKTLDIDNGSGLISHAVKNKKPWVNASLKLNAFNLSFLKELQKVITLPDGITQALNGLAPQGQLNNFTMRLEGQPNDPNHYRINTGFNALSINAYKQIPGFKNLSGQIDANEDNGSLQLASTSASLDFKDILRWPIPLQELKGKITWNKNEDRLKIIAHDVFMANKHISGTIKSSYAMNGIKGGYLDLSAEFNNGNAKFARFYYPIILGDDTLNWLDTSILSGKANDVQLTVRGHLDDFPYVNKKNKPDPNLGLFKVTARISDAELEYGSAWPKITNLGLDMLFEGKRMELNANKGQILGTKIIKSKTTIAQLDADYPILRIVSEATGPVAQGIQFINASPVEEVTLDFTDDLKTAGNGKLNLDLAIPLENLEKATYQGQYKINGGTIYANARMDLPEISNIVGTLTFDNAGLAAKKIKASMLGGPVQFSLDTSADSTISIQASGTATDTGIKKVASNTLTESLNGSANWHANIAIKKPVMNLNIQSNLKGLAVNLPAPLRKNSDQESNFSITKKQTIAEQDTFELSYNDVVNALILRSEKNGDLALDRGDIAINTPVEQPTALGLTLRGEFDYLNADEWLALSNRSEASNASSSTALSLSKVNMSIRQLDVFDRSLNALTITAAPDKERTLMTLTSQEIDGDIEWHSPSKTEANGRVVAKLKKLHIPSGKEDDHDDANKDIKRLDKKYPALDIKADDFKLGTKALGSLELNAFEVDEDWVIERLKISNPDSTLFADGRWHNWTRSPNTNLTFSLTANDVGKTLKRFGHPKSIKGGIALISGQLQWPGSPHQFKKKGLHGEFTLGASKGQILKVKPGVGRLLGLLTLQSLPRRLTLDFRDLFSEGFAFDEISGTAKINNGVMHSDDFFMTGPAAETEIKGDINLNAETQNLDVKVVPHISDTLSLAALAGGPIAGAAAFVAQKLLKDPLNKIAQSKYTITGTWDNPIDAGAKPEEEKPPTISPLNAQQN